jgi:hypothetical protein
MAHWLKSIGSGDKPLKDDWWTTVWEPEHIGVDLLDRIYFPTNKRPSGMDEGDKLVLYAAGWERIFGIAVVKSDEPYRHTIENRERYPWVLDVEVPLVVPRLTVAPGLAEIEVANTSVRQQSHIRLTDEQYDLALTALTRRVSP